MRSEKKLLFCVLCGAFFVQWAGAGTVVNLNFDTTGEILPARSLDTNTTGGPVEYVYNWNATIVLFNGHAAGQKIYGGFRAISRGNASLNKFCLRNDGSDQYLQLTFSDGADSYERSRILLLWDDSDFLTSDHVFDETANSVFSINVTQNLQERTKPKGYRFVVRDGSTYYVANQLFGNTSGAFTASMAGDLSGLQWGEFDPNDFANMNITAADVGMGVTYSEHFFDHVTGVGFLADISRWQGSFMQLADFQVALSYEAAETLGLIM